MPQTRKVSKTSKTSKHSGGKKKKLHIRYDTYLKTLHGLEKKLEKICIILWTHTWHKFPGIWIHFVTKEKLEEIKWGEDVINEHSEKCVKFSKYGETLLGLLLERFPQIKYNPDKFIVWRKKYGDPAMECTQHLEQLRTFIQLYRIDKRKTKRHNNSTVFKIRTDHLKTLVTEYNDWITRIDRYVKEIDEEFQDNLKAHFLFDDLLTQENSRKYHDSNSQAKSLSSLSPPDGVNLRDSDDPFELQITNTHVSPAVPSWDFSDSITVPKPAQDPLSQRKNVFDLTVPGQSFVLNNDKKPSPGDIGGGAVEQYYQRSRRTSKKRPIGRPPRRTPYNKL